VSVSQQRALDSNSLWVVLTAGGVSDQFHLSAHANVIVASIVTAINGTSPSLQLFLDVLDPAGNWTQVAALTAQTATGVQTAIATASAVPGPQARVARFRWTLTGTAPSATVLLTAAGR